eukprot:TRINITY_DN17116_c0_g1_i1.p1 TRINITY_DN17116_c0_g1~~TRINITY_DN17116_c0_g1_i1.p1  ORF type:complete len:185 (+),score=32.25 TRINITY_DN17116_c0_g1_i1:47-556(+)
MSTENTVYDFKVVDSCNNQISLSDYKGKILLIVNVASECGYTKSNYTQLQQLYQKYKDQGLCVIGFPSNEFGGQEPGNNEAIKKFVTCSFDPPISFPIMDKIKVNGDDAAPLFKFLKRDKNGNSQAIRWNFSKFLIGTDGTLVKRYGSGDDPIPTIEKDIVELLKKNKS